MADETATVVIESEVPVKVSIIDMLLAERKQEQEKQLENFRLRMVNMNAGFQKLKEKQVPGIKKELDKYDYWYGMTVDVTNPRMWGRIHAALGKLEVVNKTPVVEDDTVVKRGKKKQMIKLTLRPVDKNFTCFEFTVQRKLTEKDRCQVKTVITKRTEVVCKV